MTMDINPCTTEITMKDKPYSPSCDRNAPSILEILKEYITSDNKRLFEIGSGTGQHAVFFAPHFPNLHWVTSDRKENHAGIKAWLKEAKLPNVHGPETFEVGVDKFPKGAFDLSFTANTFHIMSWKECKTLMKIWGRHHREGSQVFIYGPFNYGNQFTSKSNEEFDQMLKARNPQSGIRNFEDVENTMKKSGFDFTADHEMPANNRLLVFTRLRHVI